MAADLEDEILELLQHSWDFWFSLNDIIRELGAIGIGQGDRCFELLNKLTKEAKLEARTSRNATVWKALLLPD